MVKHILIILGFALTLSSSTLLAQGGRVGAQMPQFQLQSTNGAFYGITYSKNLISVISLVGYD